MTESQKELVIVWAIQYFGTCITYGECERWAEGFLEVTEAHERIKECLEGETEMREKDTSEIEHLKMRIEELTQANTELSERIVSLEEEKGTPCGQEMKKPKAKGRPGTPIIAIPETGESITFESIKKAAEELEMKPKTIQRCLKSGNASGGYCFDYAV